MTDLPQLRMRHPLSALPPKPALPDGYSCREATIADADQLDALLMQGFGDWWKPGTAITELLGNPNVPVTWVVLHGDQIVATASYQLKPEQFPNSAWVHFVGADPRHSGKGLGRIVSWQILARAAENALEDVYLTTDDWRLPAIQTYLKLGFEPSINHDPHQERWRAVFAELGKERPKADPTSPLTSG